MAGTPRQLWEDKSFRRVLHGENSNIVANAKCLAHTKYGRAKEHLPSRSAVIHSSASHKNVLFMGKSRGRRKKMKATSVAFIRKSPTSAMARRRGFEPPYGVNRNTISNRAP